MTPSGAGEGSTTPRPSDERDTRRLRVVAGGNEGPPTGVRGSASPLANLPLELSSFVGREREIAQVKGLLGDNRLLTLTGPGGCGKTRLALAAAYEAVGDFEDGASWIGLASLYDPALVPQAAARALGVREVPDRTPTDALVDYLRLKDILLVLDNCEHLIEACAALADTLLRACPELSILATSREALDIAGERAWSVPSLTVPKANEVEPVETLTRYEAVRLFVERADVSTFELTAENSSVVARLCRRLDGIPLAIELAAARTRILSVEQISERLEDSLRILAGTDRTAPARQRTLRGALDWSYELLEEPERTLFESLSVFAGGFALEAAEAVGAPEGIEWDVLDLLSGLVGKSMVVAEAGSGGTFRYRMLEPVRQYAWEKLERSGEADAVRLRHAAWFLALAEEAEVDLMGAWLERLEREHDNFRAALGWALQGGAVELGLRLSGTLGEFWYVRGHWSEGRGWLEAALASDSQGTPAAARAKVLARAGLLSWGQGDYERSLALTEAGLELSREAGDKAAVAEALRTLGLAEMHRGELKRAEELLEEAVALERGSGADTGVARSLSVLGLVAVAQQDYEQAAALYEEGVALARKAEDDFAVNVSLTTGAFAYLGRGEHERVRELCAEGFELSRRLKMGLQTAIYLQVSALLAGSEGQAARLTRLWAAAEALREAIGSHFSPAERALYDPYTNAARSHLDETTWEAARQEGRAMTPEKATEYALSSGEPGPRTDEPSVLSAREVEVLRLVADGLTDAQVAERLYLSPRTVSQHLRSVYRKLGVPSRAAAAREAVERSLI